MNARSIKIRMAIAILAGIWAIASLMPITEQPFEVFIRTRAKAHKEEFQGILDRAQTRVSEQKSRTLFLALAEMGEEEQIDYTRFFTDLKVADIKNLKKRNKVLLNALVKEPQSVFKQGLDLKGGMSFTLQISPQALKDKRDWEKRQLIQNAIDVIGTRVDAIGVAEVIIRPKGENYIEVQMPGLSMQDNPDVVQSLKKPAKLEFRLVHDVPTEQPPPGYERLFLEREDSDTGAITEIPFVVKRIPEMTGKMVKNAAPVINPYGNYEISLLMTPDGTKRFAEVTRKNLHKQLAIVLDGKIYSAPTIQSEIANGQASVSGRFTQREAFELANVLNNPLEFELNLVEICEIGPSLAQDARHVAYQGAWVGVFLVILFMFYYYKGPGLAAVVTLFFNFLLILGAWGSIGATITLPSITALALTLGMAVDANILIFERIREELRRGKDIVTATTLGHERAFATIIDANLTTFITALLLIWLGTGPIKGFGVTLAIGIITTLFSVLIFNRALLEWLVMFDVVGFRTSSFWTKVSFDFLKVRKWSYGISVLLILIGMLAFWVRGNHVYSIDFLGGDEIVVRYATAIGHKEIEKAVKSENLGKVNSVYQKYIGDKKIVNLLKLQTESEKSTKVFDALKNHFPQAKLELVSQASIGGSVSKEIQKNAIISIAAALLGMLIYIALRFEFGYGIGAVIAIVHDILITVGLYVLCGRQFSAPMVAAVLMVIGYSTNDTIVIFDRIREELALNPTKSLYDVIHISINRTLSRTIFTSMTTFIVACVMFVYCSGIVSDYSVVFAIGVLTGTLSSIFIASPILYWWHKGDRRNIEATQDVLPVYDWTK